MYLSIQWLRAIAALSVVILHSQSLFPALIRFPVVSEFGWMGVRLFFVVSGFIIADTIGNSRSAAEYLWRRYMRIFPLYLAMTLLALVLTLKIRAYPFLIPRTDTGGSFEPDAFYLLKSLFVVPQDAWPLFAVGWSLEYELGFYVLFGAAFFLVSRRAAILFLGAIALFGLVTNGKVLFWVDAFFLHFFLGVLLRELFVQGRLPSHLILYPAFGLLFALRVAHLEGFVALQRQSSIIAEAMAFAVLLGAVLQHEARLPKLFDRAPIVTLGNASFSLYLGHWVINALSHRIADGLEPDLFGAELYRWSAIAVAVAFSLLLYRYVETPVNRMTGRVFRKEAAAASGLP